MKTPLLLLLALPLAAAAQAPPSAWSDHSRALPDKLRQVPVGLSLWHTPNPNYPEPDSAQPGRYVWKHRTMVRAEVADLEIVECGSFIWYSAAGWQANMRETPAEFAELFDCPQGQLRQGRTYTFGRNYRYASSARQLYGGDALWYILARDKQGRLYKGFGLIETEATPR
ncbi:hypothetical protein GCM10027048_41420 [Hymenobacter coalescens]